MSEFEIAEGAVIKNVKVLTTPSGVPVAMIAAVADHYAVDISIWGERPAAPLEAWPAFTLRDWVGFEIQALSVELRREGDRDIVLTARHLGTLLTANLGTGYGGRAVWASINVRARELAIGG